MDATAETANKLHRVKRPYVRKSVPRLEGEDVGVFATFKHPASAKTKVIDSIDVFPDVGVQYDDEVAVPHPVNVARVEKYTAIPYGDGATGRAFFTAQQIYAMRVWDGQSVDVPVHERLERVRNALNGQNLPHDGVILDGHNL